MGEREGTKHQTPSCLLVERMLIQLGGGENLEVKKDAHLRAKGSQSPTHRASRNMKLTFATDSFKERGKNQKKKANSDFIVTEQGCF